MSFHILLVSREVAPFGGGGIGVYVTSLARVLSELGEVTVMTTDRHREAFDECARGQEADAFPEGVDVRFVEEPEGELAATDYRLAHEWSARVWEAVRRVCAERPVDLIEFPDWGGEACVTLQAKRTRHEALRSTRVCVRAHSTVEMNAMLNGHVPDDIESLRLFDLERFALQFADTLIWAGGDILESYQRLYGRGGLASVHRRIRHPAPTGTANMSQDIHRAKHDPLRVLYLGRAERRKGVERLVSALRGIDKDELELTLVGGDTDTAALGVSIRDVLDLAAAGDTRVVFRQPESRSDILELIAEHDLGVLPSMWECWPNVVLEFLASNRPVLATPTGGPIEMIEHGVSGWHTRGISSEGIAEGIREVIASGDALDEMIDARAPRRRFESLTDEAEILSGYRELLGGSGARTRRRRRDSPLVSIVVSYFALHEFVEEAVASLVAQTYQPCEVIVVNDGSFEPDDVVLERLIEPPFEITLVTQENRGVAAARNIGIRQSQGRYVLPFDADNVLDPTFVERCVEALEHDPSVAYVTSWERLIDEQGNPASAPDWQWHYRFVGNSCASVQRENIAGDAPAMFRRSLFDAGFSYEEMLSGYEDWELYQRLASAGHYGHVIPEPLIAYRIRAESSLRQVGHPNDEWLRGEIRAARVVAAIGWELDR